MVFNETDESRKARGKAECTSAAVEVLGARNTVDELVLQFAQIEKQFADIDAKFHSNLTYLLGGGFKEPEKYLS